MLDGLVLGLLVGVDLGVLDFAGGEVVCLCLDVCVCFTLFILLVWFCCCVYGFVFFAF